MSAVVPASRVHLVDMVPAIVAALSFTGTDIMMKVTLLDGMDVLSLAALRGSLAAVFFWVWLRVAPPVRWHNRREIWIALANGGLYAGLMLTLLEAVKLLPVALAILAYFAYPLLTGIFAALTGVERLSWRAMLAAAAAFLGLSMILGGSFGGLSVLGLACAFLGALCRVASLLATRAWLKETDPRVTTWYSMAPSAVLFVALAAYDHAWGMPHSGLGWGSFVGVSICSTLSTLLIYHSTNTVGPFRTALAMNLEPLCTSLASVALLGEIFTMTQTIGAAIMLTALCGFQLGRR